MALGRWLLADMKEICFRNYTLHGHLRYSPANEFSISTICRCISTWKRCLSIEMLPVPKPEKVWLDAYKSKNAQERWCRLKHPQTLVDEINGEKANLICQILSSCARSIHNLKWLFSVEWLRITTWKMVTFQHFHPLRKCYLGYRVVVSHLDVPQIVF